MFVPTCPESTTMPVRRPVAYRASTGCALTHIAGTLNVSNMIWVVLSRTNLLLWGVSLSKTSWSPGVTLSSSLNIWFHIFSMSSQLVTSPYSSIGYLSFSTPRLLTASLPKTISLPLLYGVMTCGYFVRPMMDGKTALGNLSPAKPALHTADPQSITIVFLPLDICIVRSALVCTILLLQLCSVVAIIMWIIYHAFVNISGDILYNDAPTASLANNYISRHIYQPGSDFGWSTDFAVDFRSLLDIMFTVVVISKLKMFVLLINFVIVNVFSGAICYLCVLLFWIVVRFIVALLSSNQLLDICRCWLLSNSFIDEMYMWISYDGGYIMVIFCRNDLCYYKTMWQRVQASYCLIGKRVLLLL